MSLVGPRPLLAHEDALYQDWQRERFKVRPGITGIWQLLARDRQLTFNQHLGLDLFYIENQSVAYDLFILVKTFGSDAASWFKRTRWRWKSRGE
jgi:lipopolysaccharide/colanic/teichoic acid biosynthesis glycosyltransferase